jgi:(2Fe-2S) ferredoxin
MLFSRKMNRSSSSSFFTGYFARDRTLGEVIDRGGAGCDPARMPQRQRYLFVCTNRRPDDDAKGSCANKGSEGVRQALKEQLAACGLAKLQARACTSSCLDQCSSGVCILVEPDHFFYGRVTIVDGPEIVEAIASNRRVERLALTPEDLAKG